jgi:adhesin/invasin
MSTHVAGVAQGAKPEVEYVARLVQVLGKFDKFFVAKNHSDSELRLDFVMEVPAGSVSETGGGLDLRYDANGTFKGVVGLGIRVDNQGAGGAWRSAGNRIETENLGPKDINQQYRIVRIDRYGPVDRITISMQGDLFGDYDKPSPLPGGEPFKMPVTMQARVTVKGADQYFSYQYIGTVIDTTTGYTGGEKRRPSPVIGWDHIWNMPEPENAQSPWGYVLKDSNPSLPARKMFVRFVSPWHNDKTAEQAGLCTSVTSFHYQWIRNDGTPTEATRTPIRETIVPTIEPYVTDNPNFGTTLIDIARNGISFKDEGPGYYRLVAWPVATNPTLSGKKCSDSSYYEESIGNLAHPNAHTVGSVFYTGGNIAANVHKTFDENPMYWQGTTDAIFTLDSGKSRVSGIGFRDVLPENLYFTGKIKAGPLDRNGNIIENPSPEQGCTFLKDEITDQMLQGITDSTIKDNVRPGKVLQLQKSPGSTHLDTINLQGGVSYDIQTGEAEVIGAVTPRNATCQIRAEVAHINQVTGNSICGKPEINEKQTNAEHNIKYQTISTLMGANDDQVGSGFGECLSIAMRSDLYPTGVVKTVLPGRDVPLSTVVTSEGPSEINDAEVKITAPIGTTLKDLEPGCTLSHGNTVATCQTGWMKPQTTKEFKYTINVPHTIPGGETLTGKVETIYTYDEDTSNDVEPITFFVAQIDLSRSTFTVGTDPIPANGKDTGAILAKLMDTSGTAVSGMASSLVGSLVELDLATKISEFTELEDVPGSYMATIASTKAGRKTVVVAEEGGPLAILGNNVAHFVAGQAAKFTFEIDNQDPVAADGVRSHTITATAQDANNNPILGDAGSITAQASTGVKVSNFTETSPGIYTAQVTSTMSGDHMVDGFYKQTSMGSVKAVFASGDVDLDKSTWVVTPQGPLLADGRQPYTGVATVVDAHGNPIPDTEVIFITPTGVNASLESGKTDNQGKISVTYSSLLVGQFTVVARVNHVFGNIGSAQIEFIPGAVSPHDSKFTVSPTFLPKGDEATATVTVTDSIGHGLGSQKVTFAATGSATFVETNTCTSDSSGSCSVKLTNKVAEEVKVTAMVADSAVPPVAGITVNFYQDQVDPTKSTLSVQGSPQMVGADIRIIIQARDGRDLPISGLNQADFDVVGQSSGKPNLAIIGFQEITPGAYLFTATSYKVGGFQISATITGIEISQKGSADFYAGGVCVSNCTPDNEDHRTKFVEKVNNSLADGQSKNSAIAYAYDRYGNPVADADVEVTDKTIGDLAGNLNPQRFTTKTGPDGSAEIQWSSTKTGKYSAEGLISGLRPTSGSMTWITFSSGAANAANSELSLTPASPITVGQEYTASVTVRDTSGNPVPSETVSFSLNPTTPAWLNQNYCETDLNGTCDVTVNSKLVTDVDIHAKVRSGANLLDVGGNGDPMKASPHRVGFTAGGLCVTGCDPVNPANLSRVVLTKDGAHANGSDANEATVYLYDIFGNPLAGKTVTVKPNSSDVKVGTIPPTDATGQATLSFTSTKKGSYNASVTLDSMVIPPQQVSMSFGSGSADPGRTTLSITPGMPQTVGSSFTVTARVGDAQGNPVESQVVWFPSVNSLDFSADRCTSIADGTCTVTVTSKAAGRYTISGQIGVVPVANEVEAHFTTGEVCVNDCEPLDSSNRTRVEVTLDGQQANGTDRNLAKVWAFDRYGNPVTGALVQSAPQSNSLTVQPDVSPTHSDGTTTIWYISKVSGRHPADVTVNGKTPNGSPITLGFGNGTGDKTKSSWEVAPDGPLMVGQGKENSYTATATIRDAQGNVVPKAVVSFKAAPDGPVYPNSCTTDENGQCSIDLYSTKSGTYSLTASIAGGSISSQSVAWRADTVCSAVADCTPVDPSTPEENRTRVRVTVDNQAADGNAKNIATVWAFDKWGNPIEGAMPLSTTNDPTLNIQTGIPTTSGQGVSTIWYTSTQAGPHAADVTIDSVPPLGSPITVNFLATALDPNKSSFTVAKTDPNADQVLADGVQSWTGELLAKDAQSNLLTTLTLSDIDFQVTPSTVTLSEVVNKGKGVYAVTFTSTKSGAYITSVTYRGTKVGADQSIQFVPGTVDPSKSSVDVKPSTQEVGAPVAIEVKVADSFDNPITGLRAADVVVIGKTTGLPDLATDGFVEGAKGIYSWSATSKQVGTFEVTASVQGVTLTQKPLVEFTAGGVCIDNCTPLDPSHVTRFVMDKNRQQANGKDENTAIAYAFDRYGNPVPKAAIQVQDKTNTPGLQNTLSPSVVTTATNDEGQAIVAWTSTKAGTYTVEGTIAGLRPALGGVLSQIQFINGDANPGTSELVVSPDSPQIVGDRYTVTVTIRDGSGNPVPGEAVGFHLDPSTPASLSSEYCTTDATGICSVEVTSLLATTVKVHATVPVKGRPIDLGGNGDPAKSSPRELRFTSGKTCISDCTPVDPRNITRVEVVSDGAEANGSATNTAKAYAYDRYGNPVEGVDVQSSFSADLQVTSGNTGVDGATMIEYRSKVAGKHESRVTIAHMVPTLATSMDGTQTSDGTITINFGSGTGDASRSSLTIDPGTAQEVGSTFTVSALLRDANNNPVSGGVVAFPGIPNLSFSAGSCTTESTGQCQVQVSSTKVGVYTISATTSGQDIPIKVTAEFTPGEVCTNDCDPSLPPVLRTRVHVTTDGQEADGVKRNIATAYAFDRYGNPVPDVEVSSVPTSDLNLLIVQPDVEDTSTVGKTTIWYTSRVAGSHTAEVTIGRKAPPQSPITVNFGSGEGSTTTSTWSISPGHSLTVGSEPENQYTSKATIKDVQGNAVPGAVVSFTMAPDDPQFLPQQSCITNAEGECSVQVYSTKAGTYTMTAVLAGSQPLTNSGSNKPAASVVWKADSVCSEATGCTPVDPDLPDDRRTRAEVSVNNQQANGSAKNVVTVWAFDTWGNPVQGGLVLSTTQDPAVTIQSGIGSIKPDGSTTIWYTSTKAGSHKVEVTIDGVVPPQSPLTLTFLGAPQITSPAPGDITNKDPLVITGTGQTPGNTITVTDQGKPICTITVGHDGTWSCSVKLDDGDHSLVAVETTPDGTASPPSDTVNITVDTEPPNTPHVDSSNGSEITGTGDPGSQITVKDRDGHPVEGCESVTVKENGTFACTPKTPIPPGSKVIVTARDPAGNESKSVEVEICALAVEVAYRTRHRTELQVITGKNFNPSESVCLSDYPTGLAVNCLKADVEGKVTFSFIVPDNFAQGAHTLTLTGEKSGTVATSFEVVVKPKSRTGGTVAGNSSVLIGLMTLLMLGAGGLGTVGALRRRAI